MADGEQPVARLARGEELGRGYAAGADRGVALPGVGGELRAQQGAARLLGRGGIALCNECVSLCSDILDAELGDTWR